MFDYTKLLIALIFCSIGGLALVSQASDLDAQSFKSKSSRDAVREYLRWEEKATNEFKKERTKAVEKLVSNLEASLEDEQSKGNLDEALKIRETIMSMKNSVDLLPSQKKQSQYVGKWSIKYSGGGTHILEIKEFQGKLVYELRHGPNQSLRDGGELLTQGDAFFVEINKGAGLSRCHLFEERLFAEFWDVQRNKDFSVSPLQFGVGQKISD